MKRLNTRVLASGAVGIIVITAFALTGTSKVAAASYTYLPGDLISDTYFTNSSSMSVSDIQNFLNSENSGIKNLTDTENCNPTTPTQPYNFTYYPHCGKTESAATIIYDAAHAYGINPRSIMATMQKEQSLITDPSPSSSQINCAMGYNSCSGYVGFFNQVDNGTWQLRTYLDLMNGQNWWGYTPSQYPCSSASSNYSTGLYPGRTVTFYDSGGTAETITLADSATAALYCYTPYVGPYSQTGYSGSYNFVQSWEQWWGSTLYNWGGNVTYTFYSDAARTQQTSLSGPFLSGTTIYVTASAINTGSQTWGSFVHIGVDNDGSSPLWNNSWYAYNRPAALMQSSVAPTQTGTFEFSITAPSADGDYHLNLDLVADGQNDGWMTGSAMFGFDMNVSNPYNGVITQLSAYSDSNLTQLTDPREMTYGEKDYVVLKVKNTGTQTWSNSFTKVATENPDNRTSVFNDGSWSASDRPATMQESSVAPGQTGTFEFTLTAPNSNATSNESFGLVADGQTNGWMPNVTFTYPISVIDPPADTLLPGVTLYPGQTLGSSNSIYTLAMQSDGNLVIYGNGKAIWASGTNDSGSSVAMQSDGNLVIYNSSGHPVWASRSSGGSDTLAMQNDGNLVIYNSSGQAIWATGTDHNIINTPSSMHSAGQLTSGTSNDQLLSSNGYYRTVMQNDGNLVIYGGSRALWSANITAGHFLAMQNDGNLVIYNSSGHPVWASGS